MNTRLTINLRDGLLEVEGEEDFVRSIYQDFREQVSKTAAAKALEVQKNEPIESPVPQTDSTPRCLPKVRRAGNADSSKAKVSDYRPSFKHHNLAGLAGFYDSFAPANHSEKILCFAIFLRDHLKISPCTADDIFTCYFTLKARTKTPEAFQQAFIDARSRTHFIEFEWPDRIEITISGDNHYTEKLQKRGKNK